MSDTRCEPPPELRGVDGWHWIKLIDGRPLASFWHAQPERRCHGRWSYLNGWRDADTAAGMAGWEYDGPAATPAEVEALRAERDALRLGWGIAVQEHDRLTAENTTLRARVVRLEEALRSADALLCADGYTVTHPVVHAIASALSAETP
jgi:hypothetical protein